MTLDWGVLLAGLPTGIQGAMDDALPIGVGVWAVLVGINIVLGIFGKFGISR